MRVRRLDDETAELGMLSVDPAAFGTGAGRALLTFAELHHGTPFMQLELLVPRGAPHPQKVRLHEWYSRLGYELISQRDFDEPLLAGPVDCGPTARACARRRRPERRRARTRRR